MKRSAFLIFFFLVCAVHLLSIQAGWTSLEMVSKPLIASSLLGYYFVRVTARSGFFILALICCCLGDSLLLFQTHNELFFMLGLGSFLIAHIFFILRYRQYTSPSSVGTGGTQKVRLTFPIVLAGTGLVVILLPSLGSLKIPVMVYALVLTGMVVSAVFRLGKTSIASFWMVFAGAVLFMVSDSLLAINKFLNPLSYASFSIMVTYCSALFLITEGILRDANRWSVNSGR